MLVWQHSSSAGKNGLPRLLDLESICTAWNIRNVDGKGVGAGARTEDSNGYQVRGAGRGAFKVDFGVAAVAIPIQSELLARTDTIIGAVGELDSGGEQRHQGRSHEGNELGGEMHLNA